MLSGSIESPGRGSGLQVANGDLSIGCISGFFVGVATLVLLLHVFEIRLATPSPQPQPTLEHQEATVVDSVMEKNVEKVSNDLQTFMRDTNENLEKVSNDLQTFIRDTKANMVAPSPSSRAEPQVLQAGFSELSAYSTAAVPVAPAAAPPLPPPPPPTSVFGGGGGPGPGPLSPLDPDQQLCRRGGIFLTTEGPPFDHLRWLFTKYKGCSAPNATCVLGALDEALSSSRDFEAYLRKVAPGATGRPAANAWAEFEKIGKTLPGLPPQNNSVVPTLIAAALCARVGATGFYQSTYADHVLNHPALTLRLRTMEPWAIGWANRCPQTLAFAVLLYYFIAASEPVADVAELYRVEDTLNGWALQFRERDECPPSPTSGATQPPSPRPALANVSLWSDETRRYDLSMCRDTLLRPGRVLTLDAMVDFSGLGCSAEYCIYNWRSPASHGYLRWHVLPPESHSRIVGGYLVYPRALHPNPSGHSAGERGGVMLRNEVILVPGSRLQVINVTHDNNTGYYTCTAQQVV